MTPLQLDILRLLAEGRTQAYVAKKLGLPITKVSRAMYLAYQEHNVRNIVHLAVYATKKGFI